MKDWTGNKKSTFTTLGASSHSDHEREVNDYYATEPRVIDELFERENFSDSIWECACGEGHLSKEMHKYAKSILSTDLIDRGFGVGGIDFLQVQDVWNGDIITNPPYKFAQEFIEHSILLQSKSDVAGLKIAMFLKLTFLEGQKRKKLFEKHPPKVIYVYSSRRQCGINGKFEGSSASCYAWFVWEKDFRGEPIIRWIN
jgi:hypothetical protein